MNEGLDRCCARDGRRGALPLRGPILAQPAAPVVPAAGLWGRRCRSMSTRASSSSRPGHPSKTSGTPSVRFCRATWSWAIDVPAPRDLARLLFDIRATQPVDAELDIVTRQGQVALVTQKLR